MNTALQQALSNFIKEAEARIGNAAQSPQKVAKAITNPKVYKKLINTALDQAQHILDNKDRAQKGAKPIANIRDGTVLLTDGTVQDTPRSIALKKKLATLKKDVFAQVPFTPQAQAYLDSIKLTNLTDPQAAGQYNYELSMPIASGKNPPIRMLRQRSIGVKPDVLENNVPGGATQVLIHEFLHALDANVNQDAPMSFLPKGENSGDSVGFYDDRMGKIKDPFFGSIKDFISNYKNADDNTRDTETFAEYGATRSSNTLFSPYNNFYKNIFMPVSKINTKTTYPTLDSYNNLINNFK